MRKNLWTDKKFLILEFYKAIAEELRERLRKFGNVYIYTTYVMAYNYLREELNIESIIKPSFYSVDVLVRLSQLQDRKGARLEGELH